MSKIPVFDIGDTLVPSRKFASNVIQDKLRQRNEGSFPKYDPDKFLMYDPEQVDMFLDEHDLEGDPEKLAQECRQKYLEAFENLLIERDVFDFLARCNRQLGAIGFVSDNTIEAKKRLSKLLDKHNVDYIGIVVSEEVGVEKPNPEIFKSFVDQREEDPEDFVYIGNDANVDSGAKKIGMSFIWLTENDIVNSSYDGVSMEKLDFENLIDAIQRVEK